LNGADYKPVFATTPKAQDDSRTGRRSDSVHHRDIKPAIQHSYDRYYDSSGYSGYSLPPPPRKVESMYHLSAHVILDASCHKYTLSTSCVNA